MELTVEMDFHGAECRHGSGSARGLHADIVPDPHESQCRHGSVSAGAQCQHAMDPDPHYNASGSATTAFQTQITFVKAEEPQLLDNAPGGDLGAAGNLASHLQPDLDNLQRIREHHLHRIPRCHSINVEEQCFPSGSA